MSTRSMMVETAAQAPLMIMFSSWNWKLPTIGAVVVISNAGLSQTCVLLESSDEDE